MTIYSMQFQHMKNEGRYVTDVFFCIIKKSKFFNQESCDSLHANDAIPNTCINKLVNRHFALTDI